MLCTLMVNDILGVLKITIDLLRDAKDDVVVDLRLWKSMKQLISLMGNQEIYLKDSPNYMVGNAHVRARHLGVIETID